MPQTQPMGFQSYNPFSTPVRRYTPQNYNPIPYAVDNTADKVGLYGYFNTPTQTRSDSPFLNFLTNTARVISPYLPQRQEIPQSLVHVGIRG